MYDRSDFIKKKELHFINYFGKKKRTYIKIIILYSYLDIFKIKKH